MTLPSLLKWMSTSDITQVWGNRVGKVAAKCQIMWRIISGVCEYRRRRWGHEFEHLGERIKNPPFLVDLIENKSDTGLTQIHRLHMRTKVIQSSIPWALREKKKIFAPDWRQSFRVQNVRSIQIQENTSNQRKLLSGVQPHTIQHFQKIRVVIFEASTSIKQ